jgi:hypothetical protein
MKKIIKLSVAAALAATAMNAAVVDNVKMSGNAKLFYETNDYLAAAGGANDEGRMFHNSNSKGQVIVNVKASASVGPVTANVRHATLTTMGLENAIVDNVQSTGSTDTQNYTDIANLTVNIGTTTLISGKQELNTPLCFTEKWNVTNNTFDSNVLVNTGLIKGVTLIYADVKSTNANQAAGKGSLNYDGKFDTDISANMVAASTKIAGIAGVNAYYYDLANANGGGLGGLDASATWIDANAAIAGVKLKAIYSEIEVDATDDTNTAHALSVSTKVAGLNLFTAYSKVDNGTANFKNQATQKKTKLPTQAVYVDGTKVAMPTSEAVKFKISGLKVANVNLALQHVNAELNGDTHEETDLIATTKVGGVALKALLMNFDNSSTAFRVYANYSF